MKEFVVKQHNQPRLDTFLLEKMPECKHATLCQYLRKNKIKVDGKKQALSTRLAYGAIVRVYVPVSQKTGQKHEFLQAKPFFTVLFENSDLLIAEKPAGILTLDENHRQVDTLENRARRYCFENGTWKEGDFLPSVCHRLDTGTSGIVLIAKSEQARQEMMRLLAEHQIEKTYLCVTLGELKKRSATQTAYLYKDPVRGRVYIREQSGAGAKKIVTRYETMKSRKGLSLLKVNLITGRTHQIRAHLAFLGTPVLGDGKYGIEKENRKYKMKYQALCAYQIAFPEITTGVCRVLSNQCFTASEPWYVTKFREDAFFLKEE